MIDPLAAPSVTTEQQDNIAVRHDRNQTRYCTSSALLTHAPQSTLGLQPENSFRLQNYQIPRKDNLNETRTLRPALFLLNRDFGAAKSGGTAATIPNNRPLPTQYLRRKTGAR